MNAKLQESKLQENRKPLSVLTTRVNSMTEALDQLMISVDQVIDNQLEMKVEMKKMSDKLNKKSEYISVGEIAMKERVSERTVLRHIKNGDIPFEKRDTEKSYRIPTKEYYQSLSDDGKSNWFQNHA